MTKIDNMDTNPNEKNIVGKVAEKVTEGIKSVARKTAESFDNSKIKIKTIDKIKAAWNSDLLNKYEMKSAKAMTKRNLAEEKVGLLSRKNEEGERRIENLKKEYKDSHGSILSKIEEEVLKERQKNEKKIEKIKNKRDRIETKIRYYENKKIVYENKTKDVVGGVLNKVEKRLNPHEVKLKDIRGKIDVLAVEAKNFESAKTKMSAKVADLKNRLETSEFKAEKKGIKKIIGEIENEIKRADKIRISRLEEQSRLEDRFTKVNKKADKWRNIHDEFTRLTHKEVGHRMIEKRGKEKPDLKRVKMKEGKKSETRVEGGVEAESSVEENQAFSLEEYITNWNKYFGSQFKIEQKSFLKEALEKKMEIPFLEDQIRIVYKNKKALDKNSVSSFSERELEKSLKNLKNYL